MGLFHNRVVTQGDRAVHTDWNADHVMGSDLDFLQFQAKNLRVENLLVWPASPVVGQIIYRTDMQALYIWDGSYWNNIVTDPLLRGVLTVLTSNLPRVSNYYSSAGSVDYFNSDFILYLRTRSNTSAGNYGCYFYSDADDLRFVTHPTNLPVLIMLLRPQCLGSSGENARFGFFSCATPASFDPFTDPALPFVPGAYFRVSGGRLYAVCSDGTGETTIDICPYSDVHNYDIKFMIEFVVGSISFYINDLINPVATITLNPPSDYLTIAQAVRYAGTGESFLLSQGFSLYL